ncbi:MAG: TAXI family TRAP transporter solute-binding subunit, partial [Planctomycetota bacterium]
GRTAWQSFRNVALLSLMSFLMTPWSALNAQTQAEPIPVRIGTGGVTGLYHAWGSTICRLLKHDSRFKCTTITSDGSVENIEKLRDRELDLAIVQADLQARAFAGETPFEAIGAGTELRHIATLTTEMMTAITRPGVDISPDTEDPPLAYLGGGRSGGRALVNLAIEHGFRANSANLYIGDLRTAASVDAFCAGQFDVLLYFVGHPNDVTTQATQQCGAELSPLDGPISTAILGTEPFVEKTHIPARHYETVDTDVPTFGTRATLMATTNLHNHTALAVSKALFEGLDQINRLHLAFVEFKLADFAAECNTAPLHDGVLRYRQDNSIEPTPCNVLIGHDRTE